MTNGDGAFEVESAILNNRCAVSQVVLWDISAHADRLQGTRAGGGSTSAQANTLVSRASNFKKTVYILHGINMIDNSTVLQFREAVKQGAYQRYPGPI